MVRSEPKAIGEFVYTVEQLGAREAGRASVRLAHCVGPAIGTAGTALVKAKAAGGDVALEALATGFASGVGKLVEGFSEQDFDYFVDLFAPKTKVSGGAYPGQLPLADIFDQHFKGRTLAMFKWLAYCLEYNFADFFLELKPYIEEVAGIVGSE